MIGLEYAVSEQIKNSRLEEIASFKVLRYVIGVMNYIGMYTNKFTLKYRRNIGWLHETRGGGVFLGAYPCDYWRSFLDFF